MQRRLRTIKNRWLMRGELEGPCDLSSKTAPSKVFPTGSVDAEKRGDGKRGFPSGKGGSPGCPFRFGFFRVIVLVVFRPKGAKGRGGRESREREGTEKKEQRANQREKPKKRQRFFQKPVRQYESANKRERVPEPGVFEKRRHRGLIRRALRFPIPPGWDRRGTRWKSTGCRRVFRWRTGCPSRR